MNKTCPQSQQADGEHAWHFDGDDPYVICSYCGEMQDARTGRVIHIGRGLQPKNPAESETGEPTTTGEQARQLLHKWLGGQSGYFIDKIGRDNLIEILEVVNRRRPNG